MTLEPWTRVPEKLVILCRLDRVRGVVEMASKLLIHNNEYADYAAALELAHEELQRIREEIDLAMQPGGGSPELLRAQQAGDASG